MYIVFMMFKTQVTPVQCLGDCHMQIPWELVHSKTCNYSEKRRQETHVIDAPDFHLEIDSSPQVPKHAPPSLSSQHETPTWNQCEFPLTTYCIRSREREKK